jgi:ribulose-5-phosphate 4-epimerase/fuculose-1-phosphate aldolase
VDELRPRFGETGSPVNSDRSWTPGTTVRRSPALIVPWCTTEGRPIRAGRPSKEAVTHAALYRARRTAPRVVGRTMAGLGELHAQREDTQAVAMFASLAAGVHGHSTHAVAVSCLADIDECSVLPPLTAYSAVRVGHLPLVPYFAPGGSQR